MRLRLDLAYDGTDFHGWATQPGLRTVQGLLEGALAQVLRVEQVPVTCAGRTDTGVHARGQVAHLDVADEALAASRGRSTDPPEQALRRRLDGVLPDDVRVRSVSRAPEGFDARFSAVWRSYAYRIADEPRAVDPLTRRLGARVAAARSTSTAMNAGSAALVGRARLRGVLQAPRGRDHGPARCSTCGWAARRGGRGRGDRARRRVLPPHGPLARRLPPRGGRGAARRRLGWPACSPRGARDPAVTVVPAHGLTLEEVGYPADDELAQRARAARRLRVLADG